jgi:hypothetical protein
MVFRDAGETCQRVRAMITFNLPFAVCALLMQPLVASAWVFPEHRDIAVLAVERLDSTQKALLQRLWSEIRTGHEGKLCSQVADRSKGSSRDCVDYAAWAAIAGDHSCSAREMLNEVLSSQWILDVERASAQLKSQLAASTRHDQRVNAVRTSDIALLRADPDYATRAGSNNAHFLLPRPNVDIEPDAYGRLALAPNAELNAVAMYIWYHLRALGQTARASHADIPAEIRTRVLLAALADEAFAIHFLEDSFAAGHVVGTWGTTALRKGTHDYYSEHGIEASAWNHQRFVALGDAYMRPEDAERAARAVSDSLAQLLGAFEGKLDVDLSEAKETEPDTFDACHKAGFPSAVGKTVDIRITVPVIEQTPVPTLSTGLGELPRFRSELGPFIGLSTGVRGGTLTRGYGAGQDGAIAIGGLDASIRLGLGLEGVLNESSDGLAFVEFGVREDSPGHGSASVPGRGAIGTRLRAPFWLIPGDLVLAAPVLAFTSPKTLQKMAVRSANGGLIPWQSGIATRIGRFQFVLGREVGLSFYRHGDNHPFLLPTPGVPPANLTFVALNSIQLELPVLEYRLFRTFSAIQSSGLAFQPYIGFDIPTDSSVVSPAGAPNPKVHTVVTAGVRVVFDWRHYLN